MKENCTYIGPNINVLIPIVFKFVNYNIIICNIKL